MIKQITEWADKNNVTVTLVDHGEMCSLIEVDYTSDRLTITVENELGSVSSTHSREYISIFTHDALENLKSKLMATEKITKKLLKKMGFNFLNGVGIKYLDHGDCLTALRTPLRNYVVRSVLSPHEKPFLTEKELIYFLSTIPDYR